jgi:membrane protease YdiL (CAAX protease family)
MATTTRNSLICYLVLTFALSSIAYGLLFAGMSLGSIVLPLMWSPAAAALITMFLFYRTLAGLGWRLGPWRYLALAVLGSIGYWLAIYLPVWLTGLGRLNGSNLASNLSQVPPLIPQALFLALGEEIGWRGFLAPAFHRYRGFAWAGIGTGAIWGLWHVPLMLGGGYDAGTPAWYAIPCFMISVTGMSVMLAWLRLRSGSLWTATLFHGTHNVVVQGVLDPSTVDTGPTPWIATEFGIGLALVGVLLGLYFWRRRGELPAASAELPQRAVAGA